jgi:hypothetical protein
MAVLLGVCLLALTAPSHATTLMNWELRDFVDNSYAVARATVSDIEVSFSETDKMVYTYVTLNVDETLVGAQLPQVIDLREMGGRIGYRMTVVHGVPVYRPGEKVLVFVELLEDGNLRTLSFFRGKYTLEIDRDTGQEIYVQRAPSGVLLDGESPSEPPQMVSYGREELESQILAIADGR